MAQQHLTVRVTTDLADRIEKKARALRMETGEELTRSDVIKMALEGFTEKPKAKGAKGRKNPGALTTLTLDKLEMIQRHLDSRDLDWDDFQAQFLEGCGKDEATRQRAHDHRELMHAIGLVAADLDE